MKNLKEIQLLSQGRNFLEEKKFRQAEAVFTHMIEENAHDVEAHYLLGNVYFKTGKISRAIKAFKRVMELDPKHTDSAVALSILLNDIGEYDKAKEIFEQTDKKVKNLKKVEGINDPHVNKKFAFKHFELGDLYLSYDRYDEALFEYEKSLRLDNENLDAQVQIAKVYSKKGFFAKAIDLIKKVKNENPHYLAARVCLGVLYFSNGNVIEAQMEWQKVLEREPEHNEARMYLELSRTANETNLIQF